MTDIRKFELPVVALACVLPTVVTLAYFVGAAGLASGVQQVVYVGAKAVQFALPIVWAWVACRERIGWPRRDFSGLQWGIAFGVLVFMATNILYVMLLGNPLLQQALEPIREKITGLGVATSTRFLALGVFYSLFHSLMEEYYWRWFVFDRLKQHLKLGPAIAISSLAFAAHHVVVLWAYFAHAPWLVALLAGAVAVGGAFWAWLYHRTGAMMAIWVSHLLVDAGIFAVGYHLAANIFTS